MPPPPKLKGMAKAMTFEHYYASLHSDTERLKPLLRFMRVGKSNLPSIRQYFRNMTIEVDTANFWLKPERIYSYSKRDDNGFWKANDICVDSEEIVITILRILRPANFCLSIGMTRSCPKQFLPYFAGLTKLDLENACRETLSLVQRFAGQLSELNCSFDLLCHADFPILQLDKFTLRYPLESRHSIEFAPILRHRIRTLDLSLLDDSEVFVRWLDEQSAGQKSVERLVLHLSGTRIVDPIMPFLENFHEHLPDLKEVVLTVSARQKLNGERIVDQLTTIYEEILELKTNTESFLKRLEVNFSGCGSVTVDDETRVPNWIDELKKNEHFKELKADLEGRDETIELQQKVGILSLNFKASLSILDTDDFYEIAQDNLDLIDSSDDDANSFFDDLYDGGVSDDLMLD